VSPTSPVQPQPLAASPGNAPSSRPAQGPERAQGAPHGEAHGPPAAIHSQAPAEQDRDPKRGPPTAAANARGKDNKEKKDKKDKDDHSK